MPPDAECKESGVSQLFFLYCSQSLSFFSLFGYFWLVGWFNFCSLGVTEREAFINYYYIHAAPFPLFLSFLILFLTKRAGVRLVGLSRRPRLLARWVDSLPLRPHSPSFTSHSHRLYEGKGGPGTDELSLSVTFPPIHETFMIDSSSLFLCIGYLEYVLLFLASCFFFDDFRG